MACGAAARRARRDRAGWRRRRRPARRRPGRAARSASRRAGWWRPRGRSRLRHDVALGDQLVHGQQHRAARARRAPAPSGATRAGAGRARAGRSRMARRTCSPIWRCSGTGEAGSRTRPSGAAARGTRHNWYSPLSPKLALSSEPYRDDGPARNRPGVFVMSTQTTPRASPSRTPPTSFGVTHGQQGQARPRARPLRQARRSTRSSMPPWSATSPM